MGKATGEITKSKRAKETGTPVLVRLQGDLLERLDNWRRDQPDLPGRPEAIRRILDGSLPQPLFDDATPHPHVQLKIAKTSSD